MVVSFMCLNEHPHNKSVNQTLRCGAAPRLLPLRLTDPMRYGGIYVVESRPDVCDSDR